MDEATVAKMQNRAAGLTRVVVESPCKPQPGSTYDDHRVYLARCLRWSINTGEAPIASHGLFAFSNAFDDALPSDRESCMIAGWAWLDGAQKLAVYKDYGITEGMEAAIAIAGFMGIPVSYREIGPNDPQDPLYTTR